jgi:class 3 adenylate cyclase
MWRRRVLQVAIPYGVGGWLLVQVAEIILDAFEAPPWVMQGLLVLLLIGFPVAVILAWIFDITPSHEIVRTQPLQAHAEPEPEPDPEPAPAVSVEMGGSERRQISMINCVFEVFHGEDPEVDPEFLRESVSAFQALSNELAQRYDAYTLPGGAEELILVFGYPQAREDDARRAIAAGIDLVEEVRKLEVTVNGQDSAGFFARVGVSTGLVVVEESGANGQDVTIIGQAPRMAGWLQGLASTNEVVIGPRTQKLAASHYETEPMGTHTQAQFGGEIEVFRALSTLSSDNQLAQVAELTGRQEEMRLLQDRWANVLDGGGQFVLLQGVPGIGKSSLLAAFAGHVAEAADVRLLTCMCSPYGSTMPLTPVTQALQSSILGFEEQESPESRFDKLRDYLEERDMETAEALPLLAGLLSLEAAPDFKPLGGSAQNIRVQTMELLLDMISRAAQRRPTLLIVEDLHWADPSTLEMIQMMVDRGPAAGLFVLFTARPGFEEDWVRRSYVLVQALQPLSRRASRELVEDTIGETKLPAPLIDRIIAETDGNPLFIRELTLAVLESDDWSKSKSGGASADAAWLEIPATLQDSLAARVDNLGGAKSLLQLCSVLGREFSYELLCAVSGTENEDALKDELSQIVNAELLFQRGVLKKLTYTFKHILIQETAYNSLLKSKRKELHGRTAEILERQVGEGPHENPGLLAYHYAEAGNLEKAIPYWTQASRESLSAFANEEAVQQSRAGIKLLETLPDSPQKAAQEVALQSIRGTALLSTFGYSDPRVRKVFTRALDLCEQIGDAPQLFQVAVGLWMYYSISSQLDEAFDLSQRLLRIAETTDNPAQHLQARYCIAFVHYYRAEFLAAKAHLEAAIEGEVDDCDYTAQSASGDDTRLHVRVVLALVNWQLGFPKTASKLARDANRIAKHAIHPWGVTFAAFNTSWLHQMRSDPGKTLDYAAQALKIAEDKGFRFWLPLVGFMRTWAENRDPRDPATPLDVAGAEAMKASLDAYRGIGSGAGVTYLSLKLAEEFIGLGMHEQAVSELDNAREALQATGELFFEPEFHRLHGLIRLAEYRESSDEDTLEQADQLFKTALSTARRIESKALELKAALDRADVMSVRGRTAEAFKLLDAIIKRFDENDGSWDFERADKILKKLKKAADQ